MRLSNTELEMLFKNEALLIFPDLKALVGLPKESYTEKSDLEILSKILAAINLRPGMAHFFLFEDDNQISIPDIEAPLCLIFSSHGSNVSEPTKAFENDRTRILLPSLKRISENEVVKRSVWKELKTLSQS